MSWSRWVLLAPGTQSMSFESAADAMNEARRRGKNCAIYRLELTGELVSKLEFTRHPEVGGATKDGNEGE